MNTKILFVDSRNKPFHVFGQLSDFAPSSNFSIGVPNTIELPGQVDCTALSSVKVASSQTKNLYDVDTLWNAVPSSALGATPQQTLGTAIKNGLKNIITSLFENIWSGYWQCDTGSMDMFDNTRSAMTIANSSTLLASNWYANWSATPANGILSQGDRVVSEHCYVFLDWITENGIVYAVIDAHLGYNLKMPREVFNTEIGRLGCGSFMGTNRIIDAIRTRTLLEWLSDILANFMLFIQRQNHAPMPSPASQPAIKPPLEQVLPIVPKPVQMPSISDWAKSISKWEGSIDKTNCGNLKYSSLTASWGATQGRKALDGGYFATFMTYEIGFTALCDFLTLGCKNQLADFHDKRTLGAFMKEYAGNPPAGYLNGIAKDLGCSLEVDISLFLPKVT